MKSTGLSLDCCQSIIHSYAEYCPLAVKWFPLTWASVLDDRNNETFLHENRFHFPEEGNCVVPALQRGSRVNPSIAGIAPKAVHPEPLSFFISLYYLHHDTVSCFDKTAIKSTPKRKFF